MKKKQRWLPRLFLLLPLISINALAAESAGKETPAVYARLEPITVNLQGLEQFLQVQITLKVASAEVGETIKEYMPIIRHEMILLLSSKEAGQISSFEGKRKLFAETSQAINRTLRRGNKNGITEALFESFIIQ